MATDTRTVPTYFDNDADFRAWIVAIRAALTACGLVRLTGVGEVDATTVLAPTSTNQIRGYDFFRFDDTLQATVPIFIKLSYGSSVSYIPGPRLDVQAGTAHNGSGTLTSQASTAQIIGVSQVEAAAAERTMYTSGSQSGDEQGRIACAVVLDPGSYQKFVGFSVERSKDANLDATADGFVLEMFGASTGFQCVPASGTLPAKANAAMALDPGNGGHSQVGDNFAMSPHFCVLGKFFQTLSFMTYTHTDIGELVAITVPRIGVNRTYLPLGDGSGPASIAQAQPSGGTRALAMIWEA